MAAAAVSQGLAAGLMRPSMEAAANDVVAWADGNDRDEVECPSGLLPGNVGRLRLTAALTRKFSANVAGTDPARRSQSVRRFLSAAAPPRARAIQKAPFSPSAE